MREQDIDLRNTSVEDAIGALDDAIAHNQRLRSLLEDLLNVQQGGGGKSESVGRKSLRERRAARSAADQPGRRTRAKNAKSLPLTIEDLLRRSKRPLKAAEIRDQLLVTGYQTNSEPKNFLISIFGAIKRVPGAVKTEDGRYTVKQAG